MELRTAWKRRLVEAATLPLCWGLAAAEAEVLVGGQAVMEGVMMRTPHTYAVAVRRPDGTLATTAQPLQRLSERHPVWKLPVLRGLATIGQATTLGVRALRFSSVHSIEAAPAAAGAPPDDAVSGWGMTVAVILSLVFFLGMYKLAPLALATELARHYPALNHQIPFNLVDGVTRIALFLGFIGGLALLPDIRRVYEYHGAEHKVVSTFEAGAPLDAAHAGGFTRLHPRCGTSFLIVIMLLAMGVYMLVPVQGFAARLAVRVALLPAIVGLAYEVIRTSARHSRSIFALLARPGLWLQLITTREPDAAQLECSIRSLEEALALERAQGGELVIS